MTVSDFAAQQHSAGIVFVSVTLSVNKEAC